MLHIVFSEKIRLAIDWLMLLTFLSQLLLLLLLLQWLSPVFIGVQAFAVVVVVAASVRPSLYKFTLITEFSASNALTLALFLLLVVGVASGNIDMRQLLSSSPMM